MAFDDIKRYIPQRKPVMMVDKLLAANDEGGTTRLTIGMDNFFMGLDDRFSEFGLIEHIAQSASAIAGYRAISAGGSEAPVGFIAEVKHFNCYHLPEAGDTLVTTVTFGIEVAGITIVSGETHIGEELVADAKMKIYIA